MAYGIEKTPYIIDCIICCKFPVVTVHVHFTGSHFGTLRNPVSGATLFPSPENCSCFFSLKKGDNSGDYYTVMENVGSMDECKQSCREEAACQGIEYATGRCEVWTKPGGGGVVRRRALNSTFRALCAPLDSW